MKWTTEKPTVKGWYWHEADQSLEPIADQSLEPTVVYVQIADGEQTYVQWCGTRLESKIDVLGGRWQGPMAPEEP